MENTKTISQLCEERQMKIGSVAKTHFTRKGLPFSKDMVPTYEKYLEIFEGQKTRTVQKVSKPETVSRTTPTIYEIKPVDSPREDTDKKEDIIEENEPSQTVAFRWVMAGICVIHALYVAYDLHVLAPKGQGLFAGSLYLAAAIGALLIAHDSKKEGTSTGACWLITLLDVGIFFVHQASLLKSSPELGEMFIGFLAAAICSMAVASVWLVRDSKIEKVIWT